jgi:hypothetical protein
MNDKIKSIVDEMMAEAQFAGFVAKADDPKTKNSWRIKMALFSVMHQIKENEEISFDEMADVFDRGMLAFTAAIMAETMVTALGENGERMREEDKTLRPICAAIAMSAMDRSPQFSKAFFDNARSIANKIDKGLK